MAVLCAVSRSGVGESAVITLVFPHGARGTAMGEVGTALADDENVAFWNPAGLGLRNPRWKGGAGTEFWEPLLPAFNIPDIWHYHTAVVYQPHFVDIGGFALDVNYINMGVNEWTDELGRTLGMARSWEGVYTASWGCDFFDLDNHLLGVSLKMYRSALAPGFGPHGEGVGNGFAVDVGYLALLGRHVRVGATLMNMGPPVFYIDWERADPIPFTPNLAVAYKDSMPRDEWPVVDVAAETRIHREIVQNYFDKRPDPFWKAIYTSLFRIEGYDTMDAGQRREARREKARRELSEIQFRTGVEVTLLRTFSFRHGLLFDWTGERYERTFGFGLKLFRHLQFDWAYIYSPEGYMKEFLQNFDKDKTGASGARHGQWRISFTLYNAAFWSPDDLYWMRRGGAPDDAYLEGVSREY